MKRFKQYLLEYRHNLADGTAKPSIHAHNGKNPNSINKKNLHTVGPYKPKSNFVHRPGTILVGHNLTNTLNEYNLEFKDGHTSQIKNSPNALQFYIDGNGNPAARVVETK